MTIRPFESRDAAALAQVYVRAVEGIGARHYTPPQVLAWLSLAPSPHRLEALMTNGRVRLVLTDESDHALAFTDLEADGHVDFLYCAPEAAGQGRMSALYNALEATARERGLTRLYAEASEAGLPFFMRKGFVRTARRDFEIGGVAIHNWAVEKNL